MNPGLLGFKILKTVSHNFPVPDFGPSYNRLYSPVASNFTWKLNGEMNVAQCQDSNSIPEMKSIHEIATWTTFGALGMNVEWQKKLKEYNVCPHEKAIHACGFYALFNFPKDELQVRMSNNNFIFLMEGFGKVIPAENGYRSQKAKIVAVYSLSEQLMKIDGIENLPIIGAVEMQDLVNNSRKYHGV